jgi:adenylate kinase
VEIIELGDRAWDVCAEEEKTPMEWEQMLYSTLLTALKEDFGIILEETPTFMLMEDETVKEMMQEELVWHSEMERYTSDLYSLSEEAYAVGGAPREYQPDHGGK